MQKAEVLKALDQLDALSSKIRNLIAEEVQPTPDLGDKVLADILSAGGSVSRQEMYDIAEKRGMDRRGLGGFFRESGKKSLLDLPGTDRIVLAPYGAERAQRYLNRQASVGYEPGEPQLARAAEESFAYDWDSDEDAAYDEL